MADLGEDSTSRGASSASWSVVLLNDDATPMNFVVDVIQQVFEMDFDHADRLMQRVHHEGSAACGIYPQDIAEAKAAQVTASAREHGHPLRCDIERKP